MTDTDHVCITYGRQVVEALRTPVLILDTTGGILAVNERFEQYTGIPEADWLPRGADWTDCIHPEERPAWRERLAAVSGGGPQEPLDARLAGRDGRHLWFELSLSPLRDPDGVFSGMILIARDIHRHREREWALRQTASDIRERHQRAQALIAKLKQLFARIHDLPADIDGYLHGVSHTIHRMYRPHVVCIQLRDPEQPRYLAGAATLDRERFVVPRILRETVEQSGLPLYCNVLLHTDPYRNDPEIRALGLGTYLGAPLLDSNGVIRGTLSLMEADKKDFDHVDVELVTVAALQIGARLMAGEQERIHRDLTDHLRQAQKMEAVGLLAGGMAHDFNNILGGILGFSSHLLSKVDPDSSLHRDLKLILQSAERATALTQQLLTFARRKHIAREPVSFNALIEESLELVRRSIPPQVEVVTELAADLPTVHGDAGQLHQVVMNLCLNAAHAMEHEPAGTLRLRTAYRALTGRERAVLGEQTDEPFVCVTCADTGVGMSSEVLEHIYEPFYTTRASAGGTGLGLAIVYGIVTNHGGTMRVDSREGQGTVFTLYFPAYHGAAAPVQPASAAPAGGSETILVVDDEEVLRQMVTAVLEDHGYRVRTAADGEEALRCLQTGEEHIDLVLLDMVMPGMDGEAVFHALRAIDSSLPVLLTSGYAQEAPGQRLKAAGALGLIYKPYRSETLLRHVRQALDRAHADAPRAP